ncbi:MAG: hypothetical protein WAW02_02435 [Sideroxyarcus sp.]
MINIQNIEIILTQMEELLRLGARNDWANALKTIRGEIKTDPIAATTKILTMYGGMGSLNDIVLYKMGQPLIVENDELDALRHRLYELCHQPSEKV